MMYADLSASNTDALPPGDETITPDSRYDRTFFPEHFVESVRLMNPVGRDRYWKYSVTVSGPVQTKTGRRHSRESSRANYGRLEDVPEMVREHLMGARVLIEYAQTAIQAESVR